MEKKIIRLLETLGQDISEVVINSLVRIGNNKTAIINSKSNSYFAKCYFESRNDKIDRFQTELTFFEYIKEAAPNFVPKIIAIDKINKIILFENILGRTLTTSEINAELIKKAATFFSCLNNPKFKNIFGGKIKNASESCFSIQNHINLIRLRINTLEKVAEKNIDDFNFINTINLLKLKYNIVQDNIIYFCRTNQLDLSLELEMNDRVISPSDFGFHNCIQKENNNLIFFDFEYSGWDDPAKVTGDFFSQIQVPVPESYFEMFVEKAFEHLINKDEIVKRLKLLLPLYKIKWACIALNVFIPFNLERRLFSNPNIDVEILKVNQIQKAKTILNNIENLTNGIH